MSINSQTSATPQPSEGAKLAALINEVRLHLAKKELAEAEQVLEQAQATNPDDSDVVYYFGQIRGQQGRLDEAVAFYRRGIEIKPELPEFHFCLGQILAQTGHVEEGIACLREAIRLKPNFAEAYVELGLALSRQENFLEAEKAYRAALRLQPNLLPAKQALGATLIILRRAKEAEAIAREALVQSRGDAAWFAPLSHNLAVALSEQRRHPEALAVFDRVRSVAPGLPLVDYNRGNTLLCMGRLQDAAIAFQNAVQHNPLDFKAHFGLNQLLYRLGHETFMRSYSAASAFLPDNAALHVERGKLLFLVEQFEEAADAFARGVALQPENAAARHGHASSLARLGRYDEAEEEFATLLSQDPDNIDVLSSYSAASLRACTPDKAQALIEKVLALDPHNQLAYALRATALRAMREDLDPTHDDYQNLIEVFDLEPPDGFSDIESFNRELDGYLAMLHRDGRLPQLHTGPLGTRTMGALFGAGHPLIEKLKVRIDEALATYAARLEEDNDHFFLSRRTSAFRVPTSWSTRLHAGGAHFNHVHARGWIASAYYVAVPDVAADEHSRQGWLKFGEPPFACGLKSPLRRMVKPAIGRLVLFPSYLWHGTLPFQGDQVRTAISFDVIPAPN